MCIRDRDRERNVLEEVQKVAISNRVAVHLYLEGVIVARDLRDSSLGRTDISSWVEHYEDVDYIRTPWVQLGKFRFPLMIFPEAMVGHYMVATLDKDDCIV